MRRWLAGMAVVCWGACLAGDLSLLAAEVSPQPEVAGISAAALVARLGDDCFQARQTASRALVKLGIAAEPALTAGAESRDPEIRRRCRQVLAVVSDQDYRTRLTAFESDPQGQVDHHLPGWERFRRSFGEGIAERKLFVAMHRNESMLMLSSEGSAERRSQMLETRCQELERSLNQNDGDEIDLTLGTAAAFYFVASDPNVQVSEIAAMHVCNLFNYRPSVQKSLNGGEFSPAIRRLLGAWVARDVNPFISNQNFSIALQYDLKEALEPALKILKQQGTDTQVRQYAIHVVGRFGDQQHLDILQTLLSDTSSCMTIEHGGKTIEIQIRDIALAVLLHLTSQNLTDYGFSGIQKNKQWVFLPGSLRFNDLSKREAALKKWAQWSLDHPKK